MIIHLRNSYRLAVSYVPGAILGCEDPVLNKADGLPAFEKFGCWREAVETSRVGPASDMHLRGQPCTCGWSECEKTSEN